MDQTRVFGTLYDTQGNPLPNTAVKVLRAQKSGAIIQRLRAQIVARSDDDGVLFSTDDDQEGFLVPRASNVTFQGYFSVGGTDFSDQEGVELSIPDVAECNLEDLGDPIPVTPQAMPLSYLDTDGTLAANSDVKVPSQKAVKTYVDEAVSGSGVSESLAIAYAVAL